MTKDVVLVTINYRLGIFGFLSVDDEYLEVTGNAGLKDQVLALTWVKKNIQFFGGNPDNVLLFGQSVGGTSVHLHMLSPMSRGLFHKAIIHSGTALIPYNKTRNNAILVGEFLQLSTNNLPLLIGRLRNAQPLRLATTHRDLTAIYPDVFLPVPEMITSTTQAFLSEDPLEIIRSGNYNHVPFITGINDQEGLLSEFVSRTVSNESVLITDFTKYIPPELEITSGSTQEKDIADRIKKFYYGDSEPSRTNITGAVNLQTDYLFSFPAHRSVMEHLKTAENPIYFYVFSADTQLNVYKSAVESTAQYPGAMHSDELGYLFNSVKTPQNIAKGSLEDVDIKNMVQMWTDFARYGRPVLGNGEGSPWWRVYRYFFNYLDINTYGNVLRRNPLGERIAFWSNIYSEHLKNY